MHIGFLLNHYAGHQACHTLPVAFALSEAHPDLEVTIVASSQALLDLAHEVAAGWPGHRCRFERARVPLAAKIADPLLRSWKSIRKLEVLRVNAPLFRSFDVLVVSEKTSLRLRRDPSLDHVKIVRIRHGAGHGDTGLDQTNAAFELMLVNGDYARRRLVEGGVLPPERCVVVGYPKFDAVAAMEQRPAVFDNGRPTVLYNPHFRREASSWPAMGTQVLEYFAASRRYNLIFAPHVMLYARRRQHGARPLWRFRRYRNIHIDIGSHASLDMSYLRQADIYLGDVSSQIYEFLYQPRPCIFLDAHGFAGRGDPIADHWRAGQVLDDVSGLDGALERAPALQEFYRPVQERLFAETIELDGRSSAGRAAHALVAHFLPDRAVVAPLEATTATG